jgi:hypothetical protein
MDTMTLNSVADAIYDAPDYYCPLHNGDLISYPISPLAGERLLDNPFLWDPEGNVLTEDETEELQDQETETETDEPQDQETEPETDEPQDQETEPETDDTIQPTDPIIEPVPEEENPEHR